MTDYFAARRVLVTGGSGFLGKGLCAALAARGAKEVIAPRSAEFDLMRSDDVEKLFAEAQPDLVLHLAARVGGIGYNREAPADIYLSNLLMGTYVIEEARKRDVSKTMVLGTICSYPKFTSVPFREETIWDGYPEETNAPYGLAKKALLVQAQANRAEFGQEVIYLLPTNLYGPGDKFHPAVSHVIPALIKKFVEAQERGASGIVAWGTGQATREFLYVDDAVEGILLACEHYDKGDPVNLGSGIEISIADLAGVIAEQVGFEGSVEWDTSQPDGQPRRCLDTSRAKQEFGFEARTPFEEGLRNTIEWYRANREQAERAAP